MMETCCLRQLELPTGLASVQQPHIWLNNHDRTWWPLQWHLITDRIQTHQEPRCVTAATGYTFEEHLSGPKQRCELLIPGPDRLGQSGDSILINWLPQTRTIAQFRLDSIRRFMGKCTSIVWTFVESRPFTALMYSTLHLRVT